MTELEGADMFKSVEYAGFDGHPALKELAERGMAILPSEMGADWPQHVEVIWQAHPDHPAGAELTLTLILDIGTGTGSRFIPGSEFADEDLLRSRFRSAWDRALGVLLEKRRKVWDDLIRRPVEV